MSACHLSNLPDLLTRHPTAVVKECLKWTTSCCVLHVRNGIFDSSPVLILTTNGQQFRGTSQSHSNKFHLCLFASLRLNCDLTSNKQQVKNGIHGAVCNLSSLFHYLVGTFDDTYTTVIFTLLSLVC